MSNHQLCDQWKAFLTTCDDDDVKMMLAVLKPRADALARATMLSGVVKKKSAGRKGTKPPPAAAKRPLNSWMAFRAYYAPMFTSFQQKDISGFLRKLWNNDPFQAKWAILAKAYSIMRDYRGKLYAPLEAFLNIACPYMDMISPSQYLNRLGWTLRSEHGSNTLVRTSTPAIATHGIMAATTSLSVQDLIDYCQQQGYIDMKDFELTQSTPSLMLATRPNTASFMSGQKRSAEHTPRTLSTNSTSSTRASPKRSPPPNLDVLATAAVQEHCSQTLTPYMHSSSPVPATSRMTNNAEMWNAMPPNMGMLTPLPLQYAYSEQRPSAPFYSVHEHDAFGGTNFAEQFVPGRSDLPVFEPYNHDSFDAYNVSDMDSYDAYLGAAEIHEPDTLFPVDAFDFDLTNDMMD